MYKIEIGTFEGERLTYKRDENGFICYDDNDDGIIESINRNRPFIVVMSQIMTNDLAAEKMRLLLRGDLKKWSDDKVLSVFEHKPDDPKTMLLGREEDYGYRLTKIDAE